MFRLFVIGALFLMSAMALFTIPSSEAGGGGGGHGSCVPPRDGTNEPVIIEGNCYEPAVLYVEPGATVEWEQRDVVPHNVTLFGGELVGDRVEMRKGDVASREFADAGVFAYYCSIHPSMIGVVVVGDPASPSFGAGLELQSTAEERTLDAGKGSNNPHTGAGWGEAAVGLGLAGGLVVGLVVAGGGLRFMRRGQ